MHVEDNPLVSVIVPVYNVERFLPQSLDTLATQTHRNLEIILVDDSSPDDCPRICDERAAADPRFRVIHEGNCGVSAARNHGLAAATGDFVYFMDPDDLVEPTLIERCLQAMRDYDADLVFFKFDTITVSGRPDTTPYKHNDYDEVQVLTPQEAIKQQLTAQIDGYVWSFLAPMEVYRKQDFSFPVGRKVEDMARICNVIGESTRIVRLTDVLYHYRLRAGSAIGSINPELLADWFRAADDRRDYIVERYPELETFVNLSSLNILTNQDYGVLRQSLVYGFKLDPDSQAQFRAKLEEWVDRVGRDNVPEDTESMLDAIQGKVTDAFRDTMDNVKDTMQSAQDSVKDTIEDTKETVKDTLRAVRDGVQAAQDKLDKARDAANDAREEREADRREAAQARATAREERKARNRSWEYPKE